MAKAVWKFPVPRMDHGAAISIAMPAGACILTIQTQHGVTCMWAEVDESALLEQRTFLVVGTGGEFDSSGLTYIGTVLSAGGFLVWHIYEHRTPQENAP
ncbi:MAG: hypothetical protein KY464_17110 [Gemmatimonadetes bacterium]|nr:hypothetical protein [Gemmatimonadota bacterium]